MTIPARTSPEVMRFIRPAAGCPQREKGLVLSAAVKVAADKSKTAGITDIRVGGDDGNLAALQLIDFVRDGCVVKRADHESINTFCLQLGDSLQLLLRRKPGLLFENGAVVAV